MYQDGKRKLNQSKCSFLEEEFSIPHDNVDRLKPLQYFQMFWKHDITVQLAEDMNLCSVQRKGASTNTTSQGIEQSLQTNMAITDLPTYRMYRANDTRYPLIVDILLRNSYPLADIYFRPRNR